MGRIFCLPFLAKGFTTILLPLEVELLEGSSTHSILVFRSWKVLWVNELAAR